MAALRRIGSLVTPLVRAAALTSAPRASLALRTPRLVLAPALPMRLATRTFSVQAGRAYAAKEMELKEALRLEIADLEQTGAADYASFFKKNGWTAAVSPAVKGQYVLTRRHGANQVTVRFSMTEDDASDDELYVADEEEEDNEDSKQGGRADAEEDDEDDEDEDGGDLFDTFTVEIVKPNGGSMIAQCEVSNGDYNMRTLTVKKDASDTGGVMHEFAADEASISGGFEVEIETGLLRYLESNGITKDLVTNINGFLLGRVHQDYVDWLNRVKSFV